MERWLITGGTGFIGGAVVRLALKSGIQTAVLARAHSLESLPNGVTPIVGSLASPDWQAIREFAPQVCIHCAWIATPGEYLSSPENDPLAEDSIKLAAGLYDGGLSRFVGLGTCFEYAPSDIALLESNPRSSDAYPYVMAKLKALDGISAMAPHPDSFAWARIFFAYGPGEPSAKFLSSALQTFLLGGEFTLQRPEDIADYVHVDDVATAIQILASAAEFGVFNVGSGQPISIGQVAQLAWEACGQKGKIVQRHQGEPVSRFADVGRLNALGWKPTHTLEEGIKSILEG
jgi:nucleoside-diphosphate-sugar epimerase